jgi:hypothetical protein
VGSADAVQARSCRETEPSCRARSAQSSLAIAIGEKRVAGSLEREQLFEL